MENVRLMLNNGDEYFFTAHHVYIAEGRFLRVTQHEKEGYTVRHEFDLRFVETISID